MNRLASIASSCGIPLNGKVLLKYSSKVYTIESRIASLKHFDYEFKITLFDNSVVDFVLDTSNRHATGRFGGFTACKIALQMSVLIFHPVMSATSYKSSQQQQLKKRSSL